MELIIIIIVAIILEIIVGIVFNINFKKIKSIGMDEELNLIAEKYPANIEICKEILKKLKNEKVKLEEDKEAKTTLYLALTDKIFIADTKNSYTRIQTMAHECLHSIQDRKMLIFNFIYSNIFIVYFLVICILVVIKKLPNSMLFSNILLIFSFIYYVIRVFLENDAMIKAEYIAREYMEEQKISTKEEIKKICEGFRVLNNGCIKGTNCSLFVKIMVKVVIFNILALIF